MDFGRRILGKHGWTEGKGLGRHEHGRAHAVKVKLKFDSRGVRAAGLVCGDLPPPLMLSGWQLGEDGRAQWKAQWWDHVFNKTAQNLEVDADEVGWHRPSRRRRGLHSRAICSPLLTLGSD